MTDPALSEHIRSLELRRTQALVARDVAAAELLHAPEYQLITPSGKSFDKTSYLCAVESGELRYTRWDIGTMAVRTSADMAIVRYQARLEFASGNSITCWHTARTSFATGPGWPCGRRQPPSSRPAVRDAPSHQG